MKAAFREVLDFWFVELSEKDWWKKDKNLDHLIKERFGNIHKQATLCELFSWRKTPQGRLAEVIVLDQFSRNIYRDKPQSFASDSLALALAQVSVALNEDKALSAIERSFLYMPYMHSESLKIHQQAQILFAQNKIESAIQYEQMHLKVIERFGRYPHRNIILNRQSSVEELAFLKEPHSSF